MVITSETRFTIAFTLIQGHSHGIDHIDCQITSTIEANQNVALWRNSQNIVIKVKK